MLEKVKSIYFIRNLFIYVDENKKLKLMKYNKSLQKKLALSINNYIHFKGKYIEYELNGKGKEYYWDGNLYYEGEYLNGQRNGNGKEYYWDGKLYYEGEYLNGKRNGKGREYNGFNNLIFEGEYLNGKRNGKGKGYYENGKLKFEGEYLNGKELLGNNYDEDGNIYQCNKINGKGEEYCGYNSKFECEYLNGQKNGILCTRLSKI